MSCSQPGVTLPFSPLPGFSKRMDLVVVSELNSRQSEQCNMHWAPQHTWEKLEDLPRPEIKVNLVGRC